MYQYAFGCRRRILHPLLTPHPRYLSCSQLCLSTIRNSHAAENHTFCILKTDV